MFGFEGLRAPAVRRNMRNDRCRMSAENVACDGADDPAPKRFLFFRPWHHLASGEKHSTNLRSAPTSSQNHKIICEAGNSKLVHLLEKTGFMTKHHQKVQKNIPKIIQEMAKVRTSPLQFSPPCIPATPGAPSEAWNFRPSS